MVHDMNDMHNINIVDLDIVCKNAEVYSASLYISNVCCILLMC